MKPILTIKKKQPEIAENKQEQAVEQPKPVEQEKTIPEERIEAKLERLHQELLSTLKALPDANTRSLWSLFIAESILYSLEQDAEKVLAMIAVWQNEYAGFISNSRGQNNGTTANAN